MPKRLATFFSCSNCPAFCCTYDQTEATEADIRRLARHFAVSEQVARRRYTKPVDGGALRVLRHRRDEIFGRACIFLDPERRQCTIYDARPRICRAYPGTPRCGFYDFLMSERRSQDDPEHVPSFRRG